VTTAKDVRVQLMDALQLDLIGPLTDYPPHARYAEEILPLAPSKWYLTGFLVPYEAPTTQRSDDDGDDTLDEVGRKIEADDDNAPEQASARKAFFPSSMGLSVLVSADTKQLQVKVAWADYLPVAKSGDLDDPSDGRDAEGPPGERAGRGQWRRVPRQAERTVSLPEGTQPPIGLDGFRDLALVVSVRPVGDYGPVPLGTRSVSVFLVNRRMPAPDAERDAAYIFQPELSLHTDQPFVPRPDLHGQDSEDWDEKVADLQYCDVVDYAVGHNIAAKASRDAVGFCREVCTAWMPTADVEKVVPRELREVELGMEALAAASSAQVVRDKVGPMLTAYTAWLQQQERQVAARPIDKGPKKTAKGRKKMADELLTNAGRVLGRIRAGLEALDDPRVFEAFRIANRAIATAIRQRLSHDRSDVPPESHKPPEWRPFQLAFLLMNLVGTAQPTHADRKVVDLLFFPTGGGKTEAYLGLAAFAMVLRRLRDPSAQSAGVSVLMRYTLRLLTLDQLGRAATMICALELERQKDVSKLGPWPFEIGLWVGQTATPNRMGRKGDKDSYSARARTIAFLNDSGRKPSPVPLENCPWCGWKFTKDSFKLLPDSDEPTDLRVMCVHRECAFHGRRQARGVPILAVDDPIYRRLPAFIIATVDKFANLPWVGETAGLFGRVERYDSDGFYGPTRPGQGTPLKGPLPPPDLVIQDELHLISGPLGTMVGLYEAAIDALASSEVGGDGPRPKIVASTATVRRAERQIRALFGRTAVEVFPPPGPDRRDSFFAVTVGAEERNARTYLGVAAQGRNLKVVLLRTYLALMAAAQKAWRENGGDKNPDNPADPYMTLVGYFNSLRELGGSRRIVEDEVKGRLADYDFRRRRVGETTGLFVNRPRLTEPRELTSRVSTNEVADTKRRLALSHLDKEHVDVALATNMISVGLDIQRLGLMVVLGQPKTASEYIQATSRVGRDDQRPGLVVTLLNVYRPRDRSHYERFSAWHESFYRSVEATSVTPFSPRAIDRGIAAVTVALARLGHAGMTPPRGAFAVNKHRGALDYVADVLARRAEGHDAQRGRDESEALRKKVKDRVNGLLDAWQAIATKKGDLQYQREVGVAPPLLFGPLDPELAKQNKEAQQFKANRSLRDVEPTVNLWLRNPDGGMVEEEPE
jgi:hypothetical protein